MNTSFYLKTPEVANSLLMLYATFDSTRLRISTGMSIPVVSWDSEKQRIRKSYGHAAETNSWLDTLGSALKRIYLEAKSLNITPTPAYLKEKINEFKNPESTKKKAHDFLVDFEQFIAGYTTKDGIRPKESTMKGYRTTLKRLKEFEKDEKYILSLESMNEEFYKKFLHYLYKEGLTDNAVGKYIKYINVYLRDCFKKGLLEHEIHRKFKVISREATTIALMPKELDAIIALDLSQSPRLTKVRDMFLLQCYTGIRYSDLSTLQPHHFDLEEGYIRRHAQKTTGALRIPLTKRALEIIAKYPDLDLPVISNQKMNDYIQELGKLAGMTKETVITRFKGNIQIDTVVKRYEALGTHTGRRTFITESLRRGLGTKMLMKTTGHKNERDLDKYVRFVEDTVKTELQKAWDS